MARFNTNTFRSLNESIARIQNPQAALDEAMEYTAALEAIILDLCEELDLDPQALMEDIQTAARFKEMGKKIDRAAADYKKKGSYAKFITGKTRKDPYARKLEDVVGRDKDEAHSKKLYGKGGKVLKRKPDPKKGDVGG